MIIGKNARLLHAIRSWEGPGSGKELVRGAKKLAWSEDGCRFVERNATLQKKKADAELGQSNAG